MTFSLAQIFAFSLIYLFTLFGSAYATERGWFPRRFTHHPFLRVISLGVFAGAISFFGAMGLAHQYGASYLLYFFGASAVFLVAPLLLNPIARVALAHKLGSLADVFAFRYPRPWVGSLVTVLMLVGILPVIALQIQAVASTVHLLNQEISRDGLAVIFCLTMSVFAILFGARHVSTRDKHEGLVVALGLESIFKLLAFISVAIYAVSNVFGGIGPLNEWLVSNQTLVTHVDNELSEGASRSMLIMFFAAVVAMPHMFHILLTENDNAEIIHDARWGFPLYMLLISLCVPPILWAANYLDVPGSAEFYMISLGLAMNDPNVTFLAFIGGFAASSGVLIVTTLALASMSVNHILLPLYRPGTENDIFAFLLNSRRLSIILIIILAYGLYDLLGEQQSLMSLGLVSFVATAQFLPGLIGAFYWRHANSFGLLAGLVAGFVLWASMLFFPLITDIVYSNFIDPERLFEPQQKVWHIATVASLIANSIAFILVSKLTSPLREELAVAAECISDSPIQPYKGELSVNSVPEMKSKLADAIGEAAAERQLQLALADLSLNVDEQRPFALTQLRNQMESNLTSIAGQTIAHIIFTRSLPFVSTAEAEDIESVQSMEYRFENHHAYLTGLAAELDNLRRYHRQILQDLPTAVCTVDRNDRVLTWNHAMAELTQIDSQRIVDFDLKALPGNWLHLFSSFIADTAVNRSKTEIRTVDQTRLLNLHKGLTDTGDILIVIEDITEEQVLERQLMHNQRLASIGQLAAGVAHEVGNPITAIACLAQNVRIETQQPELLDISSQILEQTDRVSGILNSLVNFAHGGKDAAQGAYQPVRLQQCIDEAIYLLSLSGEAKKVNYYNQCPEQLLVLGDSQRLLQVFVNILSNARDASPENADIFVKGRIKNDEVDIAIIDSGHGISAQNLNVVFEPFYTTKDPGQGTGLGLAIVTSIIDEHHGRISAERLIPNGTLVSIKLPNYEPELEQLTSTTDS